MWLSLLAQRHRQPEIMDQPGLDARHHEEALRGLARINWVSRSNAMLWRPIARFAKERPGQRLRILDVATGGGDVPVRLAQRARRAGLPIEFAAVDISATALDHGRRRARDAGVCVDFFPLDIFRDALPTGFDVITSSLFLHHLASAQAQELLRRMREVAGGMILINDLIRSRIGYLLAWLGTRVLCRSYVVHADGPRSVRAAFTMPEALALAEEAGLVGARVSRQFPCRFLLQWSRPA